MEVLVANIGLTDYREAWQLQRAIFDTRVEGQIRDVLLLTEHNHVYTIGKSGNENHLLASDEELKQKKVDVYKIDRGGDITYHGTGQLVGYPILDLKNYYLDVHRYLRDLEEVIIRTLAAYGIRGTRQEKMTGVWVNDEKIAAIGIKVSRWVTMHGFAFNVKPDLSFFDRIIPCGIFHKGVTSMENILSKEIDINEVAQQLIKSFAEVFHVTPREISLLDLQTLIQERTKEVVWLQ